MLMDIESKYEILRTAEFIISRNLTRIALQFPDELLKDSTRVVGALKRKIRLLKDSNAERSEGDEGVRFFVMADTTYGSCCVDEVGALHIDAECVIHYGHTCLSPTSVLPAFFVFGRAPITVSKCVKHLLDYASTSDRPIMVLYGLEYAHAIQNIREELVEASESRPQSRFHFADVTCLFISPSKEHSGPSSEHADNDDSGTTTKYTLGGLTWDLSKGDKMEDCLIFWIGSENSAFANAVLTFNGCDIVRYDAVEDSLATDFSQQRRILKRRYYLVEKAKDANIIGILVGTLGVAGYLHMIHQMQELIAATGKKSYTLAMGRPNPAKLANFPECDVFIYISCAQTALLDSKEFLAPVITPFEAILAFSRGKQWTGAYLMQFQDLVNSSTAEAQNQTEEPRFSFFQGGYVEDHDTEETTTGEEEEEEEEDRETMALVQAAEKALQLGGKDLNPLDKRAVAKSGPEYLLSRSYRGLEMNSDNTLPEPFVVGRSGKASGYGDEKNRHNS
ncbi:PREDICTED: diphthamide biosynthesis protein 2 isoform X2 [Tarenaya hassleriana]|uniref:diphthamide biosynthesis protein 2 isoform X1 n=1 Tax=Tarenaya hassleriana TaxID=28532 RepID=UPI00053C8C48|nr:PREDICTED: diphthamide biosynthesis protein 2 isoform X1 [Tarenaya hassleriana]XP_010524171.1 PREDICTED: diphthamide biosynthesis protein 2 isoform X2 [Tarenaya hassleriana]